MVRSRLVAGASVVVMAGGVLAGAADAAPGSARLLAHVPAGATANTFELVNEHSHLCLGISGGLDNAPAVQFACNGHPDQQWRWGSGNHSDGDYVQLINNDNECLGVAGGSTATDARVVGWQCLGSNHTDQYWFADSTDAAMDCYPLGGGVMFLVNFHSDDAVGVLGNSTASDASVVQWSLQQQCICLAWYPIPTQLPSLVT